MRISDWSSDVCSSALAMRRATPAAAEDRLRENYGQAIRVWPATDQPLGFPIVLIEPDDPLNHVALGYDMYSEPVRRAAMRRAWQTGRPAASGIVELVQERKARSKQAGFLIYVPVYAEPTRPAVFATARGARPIEAFVYAPFRIDNLMTAVLGSQLDQDRKSTRLNSSHSCAH